jgi:hypothetical protein
MPWETELPSRRDQALPWHGASFAWEPASHHTIPFAGCSTPLPPPGAQP